MSRTELNAPDEDQLKAELRREEQRGRLRATLRGVLYTLVVVASVSVLVATVWLPVLRIFGNSMTPTLQEGEIVVSMKGSEFRRGDVCALYYGNKLLVKRVIAFSGEWVNIDADGNVYVNDSMLEEPYLTEKNFGDCNLELPYQVPDGRYFVMGDHRATSQDSRNLSVGCIAEEQIVGRIVFRVWPLSEFGRISP